MNVFGQCQRNLKALMTNRYRFVFVFMLLSSFIFSQNDDKLVNLFTPTYLDSFEKSYGSPSKKLLQEWLSLIENEKSAENWRRMRLVNDFFNKNIKFVDDIDHWKQDDYWATPVEFIGTQGGDCEDFALAKYFTLKAMGVDPKKMRLMYVRALQVNQAHMVLIYSEEPSDIPLVLDNLNPKILPAHKRRDLKPIYSFNGDGLWLAKARGLGKQVKGKGDVSRWEDIVTRIERGQFNTN